MSRNSAPVTRNVNIKQSARSKLLGAISCQFLPAHTPIFPSINGTTYYTRPKSLLIRYMHGPTTITSPPITAFTVSHTIFCHTRWHHAAPFLSPTNPTEPQSGTTTDAFDIILALLSRIIGLTTASSRTHSLHASVTASYSTPRPLSCPVHHDLTSSFS